MKIKLPDAITEDELKTLCAKLGCHEPLTVEMLRVSLEDLILFDKKQRDYGSRNISLFGTLGVMVRMSDKFERIKNLMKSKRKATIKESTWDNLQDISNYSKIARLLESGVWPPN